MSTDLTIYKPLTALAEQLARANSLPAEVRGNQAEALLRMAAGVELGIPPIEALAGQTLYVIPGKSGRPPRLGWYSRALVARALHSGHITRWEVVERTAERCVIRAARRDPAIEHTASYSIAEAKAAGLTERNDATWRSFPADMLYWRAAARAIDVVAPEARHGYPTAEEIADGHGIEPAWQAPPPPAATPPQQVEDAEWEPSVPAAKDDAAAEQLILAAIVAAKTEAELLAVVPQITEHGRTPAIANAYQAHRAHLREREVRAAIQEPEPDSDEEPVETEMDTPPADEGGPDPAQYSIPGGRSKGTPLPEASDRDLSYWGDRISGDLASGKTDDRFVARDQELLAAIREEQRRRTGGRSADLPF